MSTQHSCKDKTPTVNVIQYLLNATQKIADIPRKFKSPKKVKKTHASKIFLNKSISKPMQQNTK